MQPAGAGPAPGQGDVERVRGQWILLPDTKVPVATGGPFAGLPAGKFRHKDHRFEWTRAQFETWANGIATRFGTVADANHFTAIAPLADPNSSMVLRLKELARG